jgi:Spy/CpxP family protein refolding chaperone
MKAIREARERHRDEYRQIATALHQLQVDVRQLALNGGAESEIQAKNAELQRLWGQALDLRVKSLQEIAPILTPEQRAKFAQLGHHGGWGRRPGPPSS